jgi:chemotaxis protein MotB
LLFALFVVMFASSQTDVAKIRELSRSVNHAFRGGSTKNNPSANRAQLQDTSDALEAALANELASGEISIRMDARGLIVSLRESAFFPSGSDILLPAAVPSMSKLAAAIRPLPNAIRLEGHTDSRPIRNSRFRSNWELSAARGIAVLYSFEEMHGIPASRMAVVAYADTAPTATNETEHGRAVNRRVDVAILNDTPPRTREHEHRGKQLPRGEHLHHEN